MMPFIEPTFLELSSIVGSQTMVGVKKKAELAITKLFGWGEGLIFIFLFTCSPLRSE